MSTEFSTEVREPSLQFESDQPFNLVEPLAIRRRRREANSTSPIKEGRFALQQIFRGAANRAFADV